MFLDAQLLKFDKNMLSPAEKLFQDILVSLAKNKQIMAKLHVLTLPTYNFGASQLTIMPQKNKKKQYLKSHLKII